MPYVWNRVTANLSVGGLSLESTDTASGLFDLNFVPLVAGYHFSETDHLAVSLGVWAPTGGYDVEDLANVGLNYWTVVPTAAYTKLMPNHGIELTGQVAVQFNTKNTATDYGSAPLLTVDALATKLLGKGFSAGLTASWVQQLGDDSGPLADVLDGFRGSSVALGPVVAYGALLGGKLPLDVSLRWVPIVYSKNRFDGDAFTFTFSMPLPW